MHTSPATAALRPRPSSEQIHAVINRIETLSPAPQILGRALVLFRDAQCNVETVAGLIRGDPALASEIIRVANSAYFSGELRVQSVEYALQRIGFREAKRLLTLAVSRIITLEDLRNYCISAEDFWAESVFNGLFMEKLAEITGAVDTGDAYTAGLLRYIGRLAINQSIDALGGGIFWLGAEPVSEWEVNTVGLSHAEAGATLLRRWRFPDSLVVACAGQEQPGTLSPPNWLASALFFISSVLPQDFDQHFHPVMGPISDSEFLHPNGLTVESLERAFDEVCVAYQEVRRTIG